MEGWKTVRLGDVCKTGAGGTPLKSKKEYYSGGTVPWLLSGEVAQGNIVHSQKFITEDGLANSSAKIFPIDTVLVAMYGATAGQVGILRFEAATNQAVCGIFPNEILIPEFLYYVFLLKKDELIAKAAGNAQPNISQAKIKNTVIPLPPLPEQERIVAILDEAFAAIATATANAEKNLANARELFESELNQVFDRASNGWRHAELADVCNFLNGFAFKSQDGVSTSNTQLIRMGNLYKNTLNLDRKPSFYPDQFSKEYSRYVLDQGDIILSLTGTVGKKDYGFAVEVPKSDRALLLNQRIVKFTDIKEDLVDRRFFLRILRSPRFLDELYGSARGVRQANLSIVALKKLPIAFPSIDSQKRLIGRLGVFESNSKALEMVCQTKLTLLAELKQSILHKAFSGELSADAKAVDRTLSEAGL